MLNELVTGVRQWHGLDIEEEELDYQEPADDTEARVIRAELEDRCVLTVACCR